jgi:hypothetical protein
LFVLFVPTQSTLPVSYCTPPCGSGSSNGSDGGGGSHSSMRTCPSAHRARGLSGTNDGGNDLRRQLVCVDVAAPSALICVCGAGAGCTPLSLSTAHSH